MKLKKVFENDFSGHDFWHTLCVYKAAVKIADTEQCDKRVISIAVLLHDVDDPKSFSNQNHNNAVKIMRRACVDNITIMRAIEIIENVSFKGTESTVPGSIEGKIVQDADRFDALGAIGITRALRLVEQKEGLS